MILKRLCEAAEHVDLPPQDYSERRVSWIIHLDQDGRLKAGGFVPTQEEDGKGRRMLLPELSVRRSGRRVRPRLLGDTADYVLGCAVTEEDDEFTRSKHEAFRDLVAQCAQATDLPQVEAVLRYLDRGVHPKDLPADLNPKDWITFRVGADILVDSPTIREFWVKHVIEKRAERSATEMRCLVCGEIEAIADRHPISISGVPGAGGQAALVSTNKDAFYSYGRKHAEVSPVCWKCAYQYAQVLNAMLAHEHYSFRLGDQLAWVFWARESMTLSVAQLLSSPDPADVGLLLQSVKQGRRMEVDPLRFYALALSGSEGRVVIRDWLQTTVETAKRNIARYFEAQQMVYPDGQPGQPLKLMALMGALLPSAVRNPWDHLPPKLSTGVVRAALTGGALPHQLLHRAVGRARSESDTREYQGRTLRGQKMTRQRAALIKMCLTLSTHRKEALELTPELNPKIEDPAYLCGRLLAVLESI
ncbi:MAG: type I-C CRISPR-associated protein Cas8c/Csd1, partial [Armatimonadota bacterium]|nr:type I-C CRISPR-associated protein Cas8c/Csd1 [Armatimonadota bacterium]